MFPVIPPPKIKGPLMSKANVYEADRPTDHDYKQ